MRVNSPGPCGADCGAAPAGACGGAPLGTIGLPNTRVKSPALWGCDGPAGGAPGCAGKMPCGESPGIGWNNRVNPPEGGGGCPGRAAMPGVTGDPGGGPPAGALNMRVNSPGAEAAGGADAGGGPAAGAGAGP